MSNQTKNPTSKKQLKVSCAFQERQFRTVQIPVIHLAGKWLSELGFATGQTVTITHKHNKILIVADPKNSTYAKV